MLVWIVFSTITYFVPLRQGGRAATPTQAATTQAIWESD